MTIIESPILVIVGVTASGKSALAMELARRDRRIELVSVDSMQVYRRMDIGTAKPSRAELAEIRHHQIDLVDASEDFSLRDFQQTAFESINDIEVRGRIPLLVGGTGLHLRSIIDKLDIPGQYCKVKRSLQQYETSELYSALTELDPSAADRMEPNNRRRIERALEVTVGSGRRFSSYGPGLKVYGPTRFQMVGLRWPRSVIDARILSRFEGQLASGFLDEVRALDSNPLGVSRTARQALGYSQLFAYLNGEKSLEEATGDVVTATRRFARRQDRWFRRDPRIRWVDVEEKPMDAFAAVVGEYEACI